MRCTGSSSSYSRQLDKIGKDYQMIAEQGELSFDPTLGTVTAGDPPLHENALAIFELIGQLQPKSVHEAGCGGGDHLGNGATLFPDIIFTGGDRSKTQLELLKNRHPQFVFKLANPDDVAPATADQLAQVGFWIRGCRRVGHDRRS